MNIVNLPTEILYKIFDEFNTDYKESCLVNKENHNIMKERAQEEYDIHLYIDKCKKSNSKSWVNRLFYNVQSQKECEWVKLIVERENCSFNLIPRILFTITDCEQVAAENWTMYVESTMI